MNRKNLRKSLSLLAAGVAVAGVIAVAPLGAQEGAGEEPHHHMGAPQHGPGHFGGRHMERMARFLELTEAQREAARALHEEAREAMEPIHERSRALHQELRALLAQESPDPLAVGEKAIALDVNRDEMRRLSEETHAEFRALLTPDQLDKLEQLHERRGERHHRRGPGRPGHRGAPAPAPGL